MLEAGVLIYARLFFSGDASGLNKVVQVSHRLNSGKPLKLFRNFSIKQHLETLDRRVRFNQKRL